MKIFAANWKLNKTPEQTREFLSAFTKKYQPDSKKKIVIFPPAISLEACANKLAGSGLDFGVQNCYFESSGAFTGENSGQMVKDLGGAWILIGHSERRALFQESDKVLAKKVSYAQSLGLNPLLCVGESLEERQGLETCLITEMQLRRGLASADRSLPLTIAYEPVWAIGTGRVATQEQISEAHFHIHKILVSMGFSETTPILYGGSVKPDNFKQFVQLPFVDGFLIGGAALDVQSFLDICSYES